MIKVSITIIKVFVLFATGIILGITINDNKSWETSVALIVLASYCAFGVVETLANLTEEVHNLTQINKIGTPEED